MAVSLVSNLDGCFALFGIASRYSGVFFRAGDELYRAIASISRLDERSNLLNELWKVSQKRKQSVESFWFANRLPVFFYECNSESVISFDCKKNFDNREWGRHYDFAIDGKSCIVHFRKQNDDREAKGDEYEFYLCFFGCDFERTDDWTRENYAFDESRKSGPYSRFVLDGLKSSGSFAVAFSRSRDDAQKLARESWTKKEELSLESREKCAELVHDYSGSAEKCAVYSLSCAEFGNGIYAGLPWFHQRWARDELVSLKGLWLAGQKSLAKSILFHWLNKLLPGGKLPGTLTRTIADAGWLFVRAECMMDGLSGREKAFVLAKLDYFLSEVQKNLQDGLVFNGPNETWMDSMERSGARIEIQALVLAACRLARRLKNVLPLETELRDKVRSAFFHDYLWDGSDDHTVRPNVFIAAYVYPDLLSKSEWLRCFDVVLPRLWCAWGGLSSVDSSSPLFVQSHTGEDSRSYHNGDSWYFMNNLAGIVLNRLDNVRYKSYIRHILKASSRDILELGAIGHHSEVSSAKEQIAGGCLLQSWSSALFIELCEEIRNKKG